MMAHIDREVKQKNWNQKFGLLVCRYYNTVCSSVIVTMRAIV
jgi:hypothetical protein